MRRSYTRLRRRWRATRPWVVVLAAAYAGYFGFGLAAMSAYYDVDPGATVVESVPGWLFLAATAVVGAWLAQRAVDRFTPNFEPGRPRDEYLASTARWFDDED